jgi:hypothetical protein
MLVLVSTRPCRTRVSYSMDLIRGGLSTNGRGKRSGRADKLNDPLLDHSLSTSAGL